MRRARTPRKKSTDAAPPATTEIAPQTVEPAPVAAQPAEPETAPQPAALMASETAPKKVDGTAEIPKTMSAGASAAPAEDFNALERRQIEQLAYSYWEARGRQGGSPQEDWLRAEREIRRRRSRVN